MRWDLTKINELKEKKSLQERRRITFGEIAQATGLSWATIQRWAAGRAINPDPKNVAKVADYFGVDLSFFVVDYEEEVPGNQLATPVFEVAKVLA